MIFTVITNNYITLKDLFIHGKDYQAKIIFRNTIELTELCISILGNEEFYTFFQKENNVEDPTKNFQTLKYDGIKKKLQIIFLKKLKNYQTIILMINYGMSIKKCEMNIMMILQNISILIFSI
ncbi:hypothetical protein ACQ7CU_19180 [Chryseobacterium arthrosphaerae]|uniref:hypothetical protein n=1 Tax=Chryseobacterium arthrosphaerae TaxID=651561 RepID=UPI003D33D2C8